MKITPIICPQCGANINIDNESPTQTCEYCGTTLAKDLDCSPESTNTAVACPNRLDGTRKRDNSYLIKRMCGIGIFAAFAFITTFICKLIPNVAGFLSIDAKDAVIAIASFIYGPVAAPVISIIVAFVEFITISTTGIWGFIMNFVSSAAFSTTASLIYKHRKSFNGAIIGFAVATVITTGIMLILNPLIIPMFAPAATREYVVSIIPSILLPFNFAKTLMNSAIALLLYKPIISAMRSARMIPKKEYKTEFNKTSIMTLIIGGVSLFVALAILIVIW